MNNKKTITAYLFVAVFSFVLFLSLQGSRLTLHDGSLLGIVFYSLAAYISLTTVSLFLIACIVNFNSKLNVTSEKVEKIKIIAYAAPPLFVFSLYFIAFYPGAMTPDSLDQWSQTITHNFNDWHPVAHTWFIMLTTLFWKSPAAFVIAQITIISLIIGYICYSFEKAGVKKLYIYISLAFLTLIPVNGIFSIILWKDVLYSSMLCLLTVILFNVINTGGDWLQSKINIGVFMVSSLGLSLFRHNGVLIFSITILLFLAIFRKRLLKLYISSAVVVAIYFLITGPIYSYYNVTASDSNEALAIPTQQIASVISLDGKITAEQSAFFNSIFPIELWKTKYNPYSVDPLKFHEDFNKKFIIENKKEFFENWLSLVINNPGIVLKSYLKQTSVVWQINQFDDGEVALFATSIIPKETGEQMGLSNKIISNTLTTNITKLLDQTWRKPNLIMWRPALFTFIIILFIFTLILRGEWRKTLITIPVFLNTAMLLVAIPAQDFRYQYANLLVMCIVFLCALSKENEIAWRK
ncbi:hypothetical protein D3C75_517920 [compost metagenome]